MEDTTLKQVDALKKKHRRDIWRDCDGYIWFYDDQSAEWRSLFPVAFRAGYRCCKEVGCLDTSEYAPYTRISKGKR